MSSCAKSIRRATLSMHRTSRTSVCCSVSSTLLTSTRSIPRSSRGGKAGGMGRRRLERRGPDSHPDQAESRPHRVPAEIDRCSRPLHRQDRDRRGILHDARGTGHQSGDDRLRGQIRAGFDRRPSHAPRNCRRDCPRLHEEAVRGALRRVHVRAFSDVGLPAWQFRHGPENL
jgi:hypothetical protein